MSSPVTCLNRIEKVGTIVDTLSNTSTNHNGFPVVVQVSGIDEVLYQRGGISLSHLFLLIRHKLIMVIMEMAMSKN